MKNFVQPGDSINVTAPYAVSSGQGVLVGGLFGVAAIDAAISATLEIQTEGVFDLTKEPALAIAQGARVFWDNTNRRVTTTSNGNFPIGAATVAVATSDTNVRIWIDGQAALTPGSIAARVVSLVPTAAASTDLTVTVPAGHLLRISERTTVAYTGTTVTVQVGTTAGGVDVVAATDIKAIASRALTLVDASTAAFTPLPAGTLYVRIAQTGQTGVGAGQLIFELLPTV